jgi:hypothetical protein
MGIDKRIGTTVTTALLAAAVALPGAAQARPNTNPVGDTAAVVIESPAPAASGPSGFQWDDAGIGAAGAVLLLGAAAAATGSARRHRVRGVATG